MKQSQIMVSEGALSERVWWQRWLVDPVRNQLLQGVSPEGMAWAAAVGVAIGVIPIMGTVSALSVTIAVIFRLNQPVTHLFTRVVLPLHFLLIIPFIHLGQRLHGVELLSATVPELVEQFGENPRLFLQDFGLAAWHGFVAWALLAPFLLFGVKMALTPVFSKLAKQLKRGEEVSS